MALFLFNCNRPNGQLVSDFVAWCETKDNFTVFGAPFQADAQLIYLAAKKWVQGIISDDGDIWAMGRKVKEWHSGYSTFSTKKYRHVINNKTKSRFLGKMHTAER